MKANRLRFRVWDTNKGYYMREKEVYPEVENQARWNPEVGDIYIVEQSTGLTDKKGVEIFEGDRLKHTKGHEGVVEWRDDVGMFSFYYKFPDGGAYHTHGIHGEHFTVTGNIHEHQ